MTIKYKLLYDKTGLNDLVYYEPGVITRPPVFFQELGYGLCVFDTIENLVEFGFDLWTNKRYSIWECKCDVPVIPLLPKLNIWGLRRMEYKYLHPASEWWPAGTEQYMEVKLVRNITEQVLERIKNDQI